MIPILICAALVMLLVVLGVAGPWLVRRATPMLVRVPRTAVGVLLGVVVVWLLGVTSIGPLMAWTVNEPALSLPGNTGDICQRCLDAANPFLGNSSIGTSVPGVVLLATPAVMVTLLAISAGMFFHRRFSMLRSMCRKLGQARTSTQVSGYKVTLLPDSSMLAFALPRRQYGIVISQELVHSLTDTELEAVLAHESAHLTQRHHLILSLLEGTTRPLQWIPLIRAITSAVPHFLEIAADNAARRQVGTPALASALLKIGERTVDSKASADTGTLILNAAGTDRIRHLVAPDTSRSGLTSTAGILLAICTLTVSSAAVHLPYLHAVMTGCFQ